MNPYPGNYFTGDGAIRKDGVYTITGRVDDVVNVSGHRIGSAEIESALVGYSLVSESACVGIPHDVKGSSLFAYVTLKMGVAEDPELIATLKNVVKKHIGSFAKPDEIVITPALPKTRSGKIMRRLLRKIAEGNTDEASLGDISTLADSSIVETLIAKVEAMRAAKKK
jgi:acetyl-CoA synthetase